MLVIFFTEERLLSGVSPLGDMVGHARSYHTCQSSHGRKLTRPQPPSRVRHGVPGTPWCPRNSLGHPLHAVFERRTGFLVAAMPECLKQPVTEDPSLPFFIAFQRPSAFH